MIIAFVLLPVSVVIAVCAVCAVSFTKLNPASDIG
jgi:hypothetical protein